MTSQNTKQQTSKWNNRLVGILTILILVFQAQKTTSQVNKNEIRVIARPLVDSVLLRWAPSTYEIWKEANRVGYVVERFTLVKDTVMVSKPQGVVISHSPLRPSPLPQWEHYSEMDDFVGVAAQAIYGQSFEISAQKTTGIVDIINKSTDQENRFTFALFSADQSPLTARLSGLWFTDKNVKKGESYLYKVYLALSATVKYDTGYIYTGPDEYRPLPKPTELKASFGDKMVLLTWIKEGVERYYNGFYIEKSQDNGKTFTTVNQKPFVNPEHEMSDRYRFYFFIDSLHENNRKYIYRVYGHSPFGEKGPISDTISGKGIDNIKDNPHITQKEIINQQQVKIQWEFPSDKAGIIDGFRIVRSHLDTKDFQLISGNLPVECRTFTDTLPLSVNYYKVVAFKEGGAATFSLPVLVQMPDSIPPLPPTGLVAYADTSGRVILRWSRNREPDIYGYRIYRGNSKKEEFSQLTVSPVIDTVFYDFVNLKTLSKHIYYQVLALDNRQNYSKFSPVLEVERPDIVPPVAPLITGLENTTKGIVLQWANSTSGDVIRHIIYRSDNHRKLWFPCAEFRDSTQSFTDTLTTSDSVYSYKIRAMDKSGNFSDYSRTVTAKKLLSNSKNLTIRYKVDRERNLIFLYWNAPQQQVKSFTIYRKSGNGILSMFANVDGNQLSYTDSALEFNHTYTYGIKICYSNGSVSKLSELVIVSF